MADLFSMFDEPEPEKPASPPPVKTEFQSNKNATETPPAPADESARLNAQAPCRTPFAGVHTCRVGGGHAMFTDDGEKTWVCGLHAPHGFFAKDRAAGAR